MAFVSFFPSSVSGFKILLLAGDGDAVDILLLLFNIMITPSVIIIKYNNVGLTTIQKSIKRTSRSFFRDSRDTKRLNYRCDWNRHVLKR